MTPSRYYVERFAQFFGYSRKVQRLGDAANEMHLLRDAESHLGSLIWENVEPIESLADEYWNLRRHIRQREKVSENLTRAEKAFEKSQESATQGLSSSSEKLIQLTQEKDQLLAKQKQLAQDREETIREGDEVRRIHKGLKTKLEVLIEEGEANIEVDKLSERLKELKEQFDDLKKRNQSITDEIANGEKSLEELAGKIKELKSQDNAIAAASMRAASQESKEVWALRAELASLDRKILHHYTAIGRYISRHAAHNPACLKAAKSHRGLVDVMSALRRSITLNHKLAGTQSPH